MNFDGATTAEDVFRIAAEADPERYRALAERTPVNSIEDNYRHKHGRRRKHRNSGGVTRYVPRSMRRKFTEREWALTRVAWRAGQTEQDAIERIAKELADEGMRGH